MVNACASLTRPPSATNALTHQEVLFPKVRFFFFPQLSLLFAEISCFRWMRLLHASEVSVLVAVLVCSSSHLTPQSAQNTCAWPVRTTKANARRFSRRTLPAPPQTSATSIAVCLTMPAAGPSAKRSPSISAIQSHPCAMARRCTAGHCQASR
jgi:hypothetical protein